MRRYAAPMEGITGYVYRNAHHRVFGGVDRYFTPFLSPGKKRGLRSRELNDVLPEHIEVCGLCTACRPDLFWSHRKMGEARGVQAAMICL